MSDKKYWTYQYKDFIFKSTLDGTHCWVPCYRTPIVHLCVRSLIVRLLFIGLSITEYRHVLTNRGAASLVWASLLKTVTAIVWSLLRTIISFVSHLLLVLHSWQWKLLHIVVLLLLLVLRWHKILLLLEGVIMMELALDWLLLVTHMLLGWHHIICGCLVHHHVRLLVEVRNLLHLSMRNLLVLRASVLVLILFWLLFGVASILLGLHDLSNLSLSLFLLLLHLVTWVTFLWSGKVYKLIYYEYEL